MKIEKIKPIPKYIEKQILKIAEHRLKYGYRANTVFLSYLTKNDGELVNVMVAAKKYRGKWLLKQVAVHGLDSQVAFAKDIAFLTLAGYVVDWSDEKAGSCPYWGGYHNWWECHDKYFNNQYLVVNPEYALKYKCFQYSAVDKYSNPDILKYLRAYLKYPYAEMLAKLGLSTLATKATILRQLTKDKNFRKWIYNNKASFKYCYYSCNEVMYAYNKKVSLVEASKFMDFKRDLEKITNYKYIKELFNNDIERLFNYIKKQKSTIHTYSDYISACEYLGIDLTNETNAIPNDLNYWHDVRIDQQRSKHIEEEKQKKSEFLAKFSSVSNKYLALEKQNKCAYMAIIAKTPADLFNEGETLHHCVGHMNYDQKFAREESLIFFIRQTSNPSVPFVTVEYSLSKHTILQCYGEKNHKPEQKVIDYIYNKWLPYANRKLSKIQNVA